MKILSAVVFPLLLLVPVAQAQEAPSIAGNWMVSIQVTKGNATDHARLDGGGPMSCIQAGTEVICQMGSTVINGSLASNHVTLDALWQNIAETIRMRLQGAFVSDNLIEGTWAASLAVGLGVYHVEGVWKAIRQ